MMEAQSAVTVPCPALPGMGAVRWEVSVGPRKAESSRGSEAQ